ncbi:sigma-70 family RNA polymerase sigma factor [Rapidithrix thailandica]|uniref:Sigma-70 family RNA polymerase sigma factor n=1 Tax=Rapidithrix thailandica TaxID=413964 RepID=A0AAW9RVC3_9BACT
MSTQKLTYVGKSITAFKVIKEEEAFDALEDIDVWRAFKEGSEAAFHHIYQVYFPVLFNYGHQFTADRELVKDLIQDLFIDIKEKRKKLGDTTSIKFYLFRALRRRVLRAEQRHRLKFFRNASQEEHGFEISLSHETKLINAQMDEELKANLEKAFASLTKRQKEIILYYYYEGMSYQDITKVMGFAKVEYARVLVHRSIVKLREVMKSVKSLFALLGIGLWGSPEG